MLRVHRNRLKDLQQADSEAKRYTVPRSKSQPWNTYNSEELDCAWQPELYDMSRKFVHRLNDCKLYSQLPQYTLVRRSYRGLTIATEAFPRQITSEDPGRGVVSDLKGNTYSTMLYRQ